MRRGSHYEKAFEQFLQQQSIRYIALDQAKKAVFAGVKIKSFDFIVYPRRGPFCLIDVKGRKLAARTFRNRRFGQNWVSLDDVNGLRHWEQIFGADYTGLFLFAYWLYDARGDETYENTFTCNDRRYAFVAAERFGYQSRMKARSRRWNTVFVPAPAFKEFATPFNNFK